MIKRIKQILFFSLIFLAFQVNVFAEGSTSIWANASNIVKGKTVTITVNTKNVGGVFNITSSDNSVLSGGVTGEWLDENKTYTFNFTAKKVGKATITITPVDAATTDVEPITYTTSKSVTLNVIEKSSPSTGGTTADKKEYSSDNSLKSLNIEGYDLNPKFDKDTIEYKLTVDQSIEKINISASSTDAKASVSGTGEVNLSSGENTIEVRVTAENGNEKVYKIIVTVEDLNPISVKINKEEFVIVKKNNDLIAKLEHYEEKTIKIDNQELIAYINPTTKVTLVLLKDKDNKVDYYIYNEKSNTYEKYRYINVNGLTLQLLDTNLKLDHHKKYLLKLQDQTIDFYKLKKSHKVGLIYGTNIKTGNTSYYIYDQNEETLSKYYDDEIKIYQDEVKTLKSYLMIFMGVASFGIIITIIVSLVHSKKKKKRKYSC